MEVIDHARASRRRWGGCERDYFAIHRFIDQTKALCADNRHRILHTHWAIHELVLPLFGEVFINSDGKEVAVKALCERDHLLADYHHRFIPTLGDFVTAMDDVPMKGIEKRLESFHVEMNLSAPAIATLMSPLAITGCLKSLVITHNSWFVNGILPLIHQTAPVIRDFAIAPAMVFDAMRFELWMDNGLAIAPSARAIDRVRLGQPSFYPQTHQEGTAE